MKDPLGGGVYADCWHLPGGGIDDGEPQLTALAREMWEEVGLDIDGAYATLVDDFGRGIAQKKLKNTDEVVLCDMRFFVYRIDFPLPASQIPAKTGDDLQKIVWAEIGRAGEFKLAPPSVLLFEPLGLLS